MKKIWPRIEGEEVREEVVEIEWKEERKVGIRMELERRRMTRREQGRSLRSGRFPTMKDDSKMNNCKKRKKD
jgi:hypothetical protein